jgi:hypothetical protein
LTYTVRSSILIFLQKMELVQTSLFHNLPKDILLLLILYCTNLSKFVLHFVSKQFRSLTMDTKKNRELGTSFIMYLIQEKCECTNYKNKLCVLAVRESSLTILKWFRINKYYWNSETYVAALNGYYKLLKKCSMDELIDACEFVDPKCNPSKIKFIRQIGCPWDDERCDNKELYGHLEELKVAGVVPCEYLVLIHVYKNIFHTDEHIHNSTEIHGCLDVLKFVHENS